MSYIPSFPSGSRGGGGGSGGYTGPSRAQREAELRAMSTKRALQDQMAAAHAQAEGLKKEINPKTREFCQQNPHIQFCKTELGKR